MRKALFIVLFALLLSVTLTARSGQRVHFGAEWGMSQTLGVYHHFNFLESTIGYRVDDRGWDYSGSINAYVSGKLSVDLGERLSLSAIGGYYGVAESRRLIPLMLQAEWYPRGNENNGLFLFAGGGYVLGKFTNTNHSWAIRPGAGYRIALGSSDFLDVVLSLRCMHDKPRVWDRDEHIYVSRHNTLRNNVWYYALSLGVALSF